MGTAGQQPGAARRAAVEALLRIEQGQGYSNIVLDNCLKDGHLNDADRALTSRLVYGVVERRLTLDYLLASCSSMPLKRMHPIVRELLRVGAYQLAFMGKIPAAAAVSEAVLLAKAMKQGHASGFVNGVLRGVERRKTALLEALGDSDAQLAIRYSCPQELLRLWREAYGDARMRSLLEQLNTVPPAYIRVNTLHITPENFQELLTAQGIAFEPLAEDAACLRIADVVLLKRVAKIRENWYYYQDIASQLCCRALGARPGERVADLCAAPGGKSFTLAQHMHNTGTLFSSDLYAAKCDTMEARAAKLGITILQTAARDASAPCPEPLRQSFDRVLCDVPCSGLGVIRRKPEIRYHAPASFAALPELQYAILEQGANMVRPGGVLQYSTCTLNPAENERVVARFLSEHAEFSPRRLPLEPWFAMAEQPVSHGLTLFPPVHGTDGFFIAGFQKDGV